MDLELGQVIRRCLDRDLQPGRPAAPGGTRARPGAGQRGHLGNIQPGPGPVHGGVKDVLHLPSGGKQQVAAVFDLVGRVGVREAGPLLAGQVKAEDQAGGADPPVDDLAQPPCSRILRQGVCDLSQAGRIRGTSKAVALLGEADPFCLRGDGDVLVSVQQHLGAERGMPGHLDRQVPPLPVHDVEAVVIHIGALPGQVADHRAVRGPVHIPHHRRGPGDQDHEHSRSHRMGAQILLRDQVLAFPRRAVDHRDGIAGGPGPDPPREPPRQPHQVSVVQHRIRLGVTTPDHAPPPGPEPAGRIAHRVAGIQHDPVHAVIGTGQQARIARREVISHPPTVGPRSASRQPDCPEGATPSGQSPGRSVVSLCVGKVLSRVYPVPGSFAF